MEALLTEPTMLRKCLVYGYDVMSLIIYPQLRLFREGPDHGRQKEDGQAYQNRTETLQWPPKRGQEQRMGLG